MALVTLRIVDGPERGKIYEQLSTPITIGREEGNVVRLNDERISRFHLKIHENGGIVLVSDLDSTNGTRVNGEVVQLWKLRPGDMISLGRSVILVGDRGEIARRLKDVEAADNFAKRVAMGFLQEDIDEQKALDKAFASQQMQYTGEATTGLLEALVFHGLVPEDLVKLHSLLPPALPEKLTPPQMTQLLEVLQYIFLRIRYLVGSVERNGTDERVTLSLTQWQNLLDLYDRLALDIKSITEP